MKFGASSGSVLYAAGQVALQMAGKRTPVRIKSFPDVGKTEVWAVYNRNNLFTADITGTFYKPSSNEPYVESFLDAKDFKEVIDCYKNSEDLLILAEEDSDSAITIKDNVISFTLTDTAKSLTPLTERIGDAVVEDFKEEPTVSFFSVRFDSLPLFVDEIKKLVSSKQNKVGTSFWFTATEANIQVAEEETVKYKPQIGLDGPKKNAMILEEAEIAVSYDYQFTSLCLDLSTLLKFLEAHKRVANSCQTSPQGEITYSIGPHATIASYPCLSKINMQFVYTDYQK